jgi:hypothetical protein
MHTTTKEEAKMRKKINRLNQSGRNVHQSQTMRFSSFSTSYRVISLLIATVFAISLTGCGEPYRNEGNKLSEEINKELMIKKQCNSTQECNKIFRAFAGHDTHVSFSVYAPDRQVLAIVFKFLIEKGIIITNGVPIFIKVYPKPNEEYENNLFNSSTITLEINQ